MNRYQAPVDPIFLSVDDLSNNDWDIFTRSKWILYARGDVFTDSVKQQREEAKELLAKRAKMIGANALFIQGWNSPTVPGRYSSLTDSGNTARVPEAKAYAYFVGKKRKTGNISDKDIPDMDLAGDRLYKKVFFKALFMRYVPFIGALICIVFAGIAGAADDKSAYIFVAIMVICICYTHSREAHCWLKEDSLHRFQKYSR